MPDHRAGALVDHRDTDASTDTNAGVVTLNVAAVAEYPVEDP